MSDAGNASQDKIDTPLLIYILYFAALIIGITAVIGLVWAYMEKNNASEWLQTHYVFLIHTFWKGLLYFVVGMILSIIYVGFLVLIGLVIWWIIRCIKGVQLLRKHEPVSDPTGWLI